MVDIHGHGGDSAGLHQIKDWTLHLEAFAVMLPWLTVYDHTNYAHWRYVHVVDMKLLGKKHKLLEGLTESHTTFGDYVDVFVLYVTTNLRNNTKQK